MRPTAAATTAAAAAGCFCDGLLCYLQFLIGLVTM